MPKEMSWLSPRRRRTTGNLKAIPNGTVNNDTSNGAIPAVPVAVRPTSTHRPISQPVIPTTPIRNGSSDGDGNLFYAYARKGDDLKSRYLLTFASAAVASEWWYLLQTHFPDASRPGPQLFSFDTDDLLTKAWRHPSFSHLKSKWMYLSFSDAPGEGLGGAAQGIIPVQDEEGNMLGGSAPATPELATQVKREAREVKSEVIKMEEYFQKMVAAVERNTDKVAELAEKRMENKTNDLAARVTSERDESGSANSIDAGVLSGHFVRMNELLAKNSQHVEELTKKHYDNEQKLRQTIENLASQQKNDYLDMQQLSSHLDRIQSLMETSEKQRKDSVRETSEQHVQAPQFDFSPLTDRLEKVQEAVEQNSALVKVLLDEGAGGSNSPARTPFWGKEPPAPIDLSPLNEQFERLQGTIEKQSEHMKALVGYASGDIEPRTSQPNDNLAPLGEPLEQIYNAIEEGNKNAKENRALDFSPLGEHLQALREHFENAKENKALDFSPLGEHFQALREHSEKSKDQMQRLLEAQNATRVAVEANGGDVDFTPIAEHLDSIRESNETNVDYIKKLFESQEATRRESSLVDFTPLKDHLDAVRTATEKSSEHIRSLVDSQQSSAKANQSPQLDLTPLTDRLNKIQSVLEKQAERQTQIPSNGDPKFVMNALTSHLSKIQGVTDANAHHVKTLREKQSSTSDKMTLAVSQTSDQIRVLVQQNKEQEQRNQGQQQRNQDQEARIEVQNSQMRELMSGQREMVEVMRQLARSVVAQTKGNCDHVVVPPPRKMGRKIVGFVYDAKEGMA